MQHCARETYLLRSDYARDRQAEGIGETQASIDLDILDALL